MNKETIFTFAMGILFHRGALSPPNDRISGILSICAFVIGCHKSLGGILIQSFVEKVTGKRPTMFTGLFLLICAIFFCEALIVHMVVPFLPKILVSAVERIGGIFIGLAIFLIISSLWVLSRCDIETCVYTEQGIYTYIRHPYYVGLGLLYIGCCLSICNIFSIVLAFYIFRVHITEHILREEAYLLQKNKSYLLYKERVCLGIPNWFKKMNTPMDDPESSSVHSISAF
ncbi:hypothetical protein NEFER03_0834 [Nematocida sp. LUAm3]|nr:hypothetical protein NEFER03_0834 [Nematocida sp. LUAm3]KAI5174852.1 hypothetical protein NEFER02_0952 [Nematocida sp. LUAm2]KAI5177550.1 hypothetical protein NEFER01_0800 [Nematocida sp. LUAm1]